MNKTIIIIMAGGNGKRMESPLPKVLHNLDDIPLIVRIINTSKLLNPRKILVVVGKDQKLIEETIQQYIDLSGIVFVNQPFANGTGDAIKCCYNELQPYINDNILILSGDVPLITKEIMFNILNDLNVCKIVVANSENPFGLGRIIMKQNSFEKIVEEKDCTNDQKKISLINTGVYAFKSEILCKYLPYIKNNNMQQEYYLTDIIEIIKINENINIQLLKILPQDLYKLTGVNTKKQLKDLEELYKSFF